MPLGDGEIGVIKSDESFDFWALRCVQETRHDIGEVPAEQRGLEPYRNHVGTPPARFGRAGDGGFAGRAFPEHLPIQAPRLTAPDIVRCAAGISFPSSLLRGMPRRLTKCKANRYDPCGK